MSTATCFLIAVISLGTLILTLRIGFVIGKMQGVSEGKKQSDRYYADLLKKSHDEKEEKIKKIADLVLTQENQMNIFKEEWFKRSKARKKKKYRSIDEQETGEK